MKKKVQIFFTVVLCILFAACFFKEPLQAAGKKAVKREIAIVFDNSGSMYGSQLSWCRATYAVEVFASMLNKGDVLRVYPMNKMTIGSKSYNMANPLVINGGGNASIIREAYTVSGQGNTPVEAVTSAYKGISSKKADEKWLVVLTDGTQFHKNDNAMSIGASKKALTKMLSDYVKKINIMYLGIGTSPVMPDVKGNAEHIYYALQAGSSNDILKSLTSMCNIIFGRDELKTNNRMRDFDIPMSRLIVFVQGKNVNNVDISDKKKKKNLSPDKIYTPKYSKKGNGGKFKIDYNLSGVVAVYSDVPAGKYNLKYNGNVSDTGVYYEPDVDLKVTLTDKNGTDVNDMEEVYPGTYYIKYGLVNPDGSYTKSPLLGKCKYNITYTKNGKSKVKKSSSNGKIPVNLIPGDKMDISAEVVYLGGYVIKKNAKDLGWPGDGISVSDWPAGNLEMSVSGGKNSYKQSEIEEYGQYKAEFFYNGNLLEGSELDNIKFTADISEENLKCGIYQKQDAYYFNLQNKGKPYETSAGSYTLELKAVYTDENQNTAEAGDIITFDITSELHKLELEFEDGQDFFKISGLDSAKPVKAFITKDGRKLSGEEFKSAEVKASTDGLVLIVKPDIGSSAYNISVDTGKEIKQGIYNINLSAVLKDETGYSMEAEAVKKIELRPYSKGVVWAARIAGGLLVLAACIWYMTRKVLPKNIKFKNNIAAVADGIIILNAKSDFRIKDKELKITGRSSTDGTMCKVIIKLEPVSRRYTRSKNRKAGIADVNVTGTFKQEADVSVKWPAQIFLKVDKDVTKNLKGEKKTNSTFEFSAFNAAGKPVGFNGNIIYK